MILLLAAAVYAAALETTPLDTRAQAIDVRDAALDAGHDARLVREYLPGQGWQYTVRLDGFDGATQAEEAATTLAESTGVTLVVLGEVAPVPVEPPAAAATVVEPGHPKASVVLEQAVRAMGGRDGGAGTLAAAPGVRFVFERTVVHDGSELVAVHTFLRDPAASRLAIDGDAPVQPSITQIDADGTWLSVAGERTAQDGERTREVLSAFEPEQLMAFPLGFGQLVDSDPAWAELETVDVVGEGTDRVFVLQAGSDASGLEVRISEADWRVLEVLVRSDSGTSRHAFSDWRELDTGLVVPFAVEHTRDGQMVSRLQVRELALVDAHPEGSFQLPETP